MTKIGTLRLSVAGALLALVDPTNRVIAAVEGNQRIGPDGRWGPTHGDNLQEAERKAVAERLMLCWNTCEGLSNETLADKTLTMKNFTDAVEYAKQMLNSRKVGDGIDNVVLPEDERWTITGKEPGTADGVPLDENADTQEIPVQKPEPQDPYTMDVEDVIKALGEGVGDFDDGYDEALEEVASVYLADAATNDEAKARLQEALDVFKAELKTAQDGE